MLEKKIRLEAFEDVREFVQAASRCSYDVDISYNRMVIDAKSILGVMCLDRTKDLTVQYRPEDKALEKVLSKFSGA